MDSGPQAPPEKKRTIGKLRRNIISLFSDDRTDQTHRIVTDLLPVRTCPLRIMITIGR